MRYTLESVEVAQHLAGLLALDRRLGPGDLQAALHAHAVALDLVDEVLTGQARLQRVPANAPHSEVERNPVAALARETRRHPRVVEGAPSDVLRRDADAPVRDLWIGLAAHSAAAQVAWERDAIKTRQSSEQAWATVADAAALAASLARLGRDLSDALADGGDSKRAKQFRDSANSMQTAAAVTLDLARVGPVEDVGQLEVARPHPVAVPIDVLVAQHTTAGLLHGAPSLKPTDVIRVASDQMQIASLLGARLAPVDADLGEALLDLAEHFDPVATHYPLVASIHPGNRAAHAQCRQTWEAIRRFDHPTDLSIAGMGFLGGARAVGDALRDVVSDHESRGVWLHEMTSRKYKLVWQRRFVACSRLASAVETLANSVGADDRFAVRTPPQPLRPSEVLPTWTSAARHRPAFPLAGIDQRVDVSRAEYQRYNASSSVQRKRVRHGNAVDAATRQLSRD